MIQTALELKDAGIAKALAHADAVEPGWHERAMALALQFAARDGAPFRGEEVRAWVEHDGLLPPPPHVNAWGGVFRHLARRGYIGEIGFDNATSPKSHGRLTRIWVITVAGMTAAHWEGKTND